jgi:hypothetical protein
LPAPVNKSIRYAGVVPFVKREASRHKTFRTLFKCGVPPRREYCPWSVPPVPFSSRKRSTLPQVDMAIQSVQLILLREKKRNTRLC